MRSSAHIIVTGIVQGVGFRYFAYRHAVRLNLKGWVCNRYYNQVEVEVEGEKSNIEELIDQLRDGPRFAEVQKVDVTWIDFQGQYTSFDVTY